MVSFMLKICRVRVANELGAGNGKGAKFAAKVSLVQSNIMGIIFCVLILIFHQQLALIFSYSKAVIKATDKFSLLMALTILLNSIQPVLSGENSNNFSSFCISYKSSNRIMQKRKAITRGLFKFSLQPRCSITYVLFHLYFFNYYIK